jgi:hypothetical protein
MSQTKTPMTNLLQSIDDEGIKNVMRYFQMDDYDVMLRYIAGIGVKRKSAKDQM